MKKLSFLIIFLLGLIGNLDAQSFKMQVEKVDGTVFSVPADYVKQVTFLPVETYTVSYTLNGVTSSNTISSLAEGMPYTTNLIPDDNCYISSISVTMRGYDITSTAYSNGEVKINEVTGNIQILASS